MSEPDERFVPLRLFGVVATAIVTGFATQVLTEPCGTEGWWDLAALLAIVPVASFFFALPNPTLGRYLLNGVVACAAVAIAAFDEAWDYANAGTVSADGCYIEVPIAALVVGWIPPAIAVVIGAVPLALWLRHARRH